MQNVGDLENIFKFGVEWKRGRKNVRFSTENWPYLENGERLRLLLITNRKAIRPVR